MLDEKVVTCPESTGMTAMSGCWLHGLWVTVLSLTVAAGVFRGHRIYHTFPYRKAALGHCRSPGGSKEDEASASMLGRWCFEDVICHINPCRGTCSYPVVKNQDILHKILINEGASVKMWRECISLSLLTCLLLLSLKIIIDIKQWKSDFIFYYVCAKILLSAFDLFQCQVSDT